MSGIAGVLYRSHRAAPSDAAERMASAIAHRGPDGAGYWTQGPVAVGHRMLSTTPESVNEKMPFSWDNGRLVVTADIRLDNRAELFRELAGTLPDSFAPDSAYLAAAYDRWGEKVCEKLLGDFSFAIWDARAKKFFFGRDLFGAKPFYYYEGPDFFAFASEIKAILALGGVPRRLNETALADHLLWCSEDPEITFYQGVKRLPAAHTATASARSFEKKRYWQLDPGIETRLPSDAAYAEALRSLFKEAVSCRLRSAGPVGSLLSGGLDSSSIVCTAAGLLKKQNQKIHSFSWLFTDVPQCDESEYIRAAASVDGVEAHFIRADLVPPFRDIDRIFWHLDEPHSCNIAMSWNGIYPEAKKNGVRVLLDGDGGDEVVSRGYPYLAELLGKGRFIEWARTAVPLAKKINRPLWEIFWQISLRPHVPAFFHWGWRYLRWGGRPLWLDGTYVNPDFAKRVGLGERAADLLGYEMHPGRTVKDDDWQTLVSAPTAYTFEIMNRLSAAFGIEYRYPFFDRRLVEFCFGLPSEQKLYRGWTRIVMRRAMEGILPDAIRWRGNKTYNDLNITHGLKRFEAEELHSRIVERSEIIEPYADIPALQKAYRDFMKKPDYVSTTSVWQMAMLSRWLESSKLEI